MKPPSKIALVGNPNSGKSSLFNALTGMRQKVGNFPGVTIDRKSGRLNLAEGHRADLIDLPGTYNLYPDSEDERIACEILRDPSHPDHPDLIVMVADATQLKRSLLLCTQLIDLRLPVVLALNMVDLLEKEGITIDVQRLSRLLDVPVVPVSALKGQGVPELKALIAQAPAPSTHHIMTLPSGFQPALQQIQEFLPGASDYLAYQVLLKPEEFAPMLNGHRLPEAFRVDRSEGLISNELLVRYDWIDNLLPEVIKEPPSVAETFTHKLDQLLLHKVWGYVLFVVILLLIFQALFSFAAYPMDWIDVGFGWTGEQLERFLPESWWADLFINGVWAGLGGIVIFIPQIAFLFFFIAVLEESGYMSRVVFLMDRIMQPFGFSGRSVIPLIGGMACAIPSIMMTRSIPNYKERLITIMVTPLMSCSARIPVYVLLIAMFVPADSVLGFFTLQGVVMLGFYLLGFAMALAMAYVFKRVLRYRSDGMFVAEMPIYRLPRWPNVGITIYQKGRAFVLEAGKIIIIISIALWFLANFAPGDRFEEITARYEPQIAAASTEAAQDSLKVQQASEKLRASYAGQLGLFIEPAIRPLGFDWKIGISLITSFAAREVFVGTMATIYSLEEPEDETDEKNMANLREQMLASKDPETGKPVYTTAVALSLLMFYAFAMQCMSTLAVTRRETGSWKWTLVMLFYLTALAYLASFLTYQGLS